MVNQVNIQIQTAPGTWMDITSFVRQSAGITITRGRSDEQSQASPQRLMFTLNNIDGRFSPRNPLSPLYGKIGRNTPVRCQMDGGTFDRFYGFVSAWPPQWNENHTDNFVQIQADGILRRLGQGQPVVSNALRDWIVAQSTLYAYYPMAGGEDTIYSQNLAPGKSGSFAGYNSPLFKYGIDMGAPWIGTGLQINATGDSTFLQGTVNSMGTNIALDFVFQSQGFGVLDVLIFPTGYDYFRLRMNTSADAGTMQVSYWAEGFIDAVASGVVPELQDTQLHTCRFELRQVAGPFVSFFVYIDGALVYTLPSFVGASLTRCPYFRFHYSRFVNQTYVNVAHVAVWSDNTAANIPSVTDYTTAAFAHAGETAMDRIDRVCSDGGIPIDLIGAAAESMPMGPQFSETRLEQIREAESTDMGILFEDRVSEALVYRSRTSMYNQTEQFELDYAAGHLSPPLQPVDDDQDTRNDVTATRRDGGSARFTVDTGPLSTQDPPTGAGRYEAEVTVNPENDGFLQGIAAWIANIGTLDRARWPQVTVNLSSPNIPVLLRTAIRNADVGDLFTITNLQDAFVYDDVPLIIVGYSETITPYVHLWTGNCMPAEPFSVGGWSASASSGSFRWDTGGSTLNSNATSTATSLSIATAAGNALWTTDSAARPFDVNIGGERVRVTNVTGSSSPQTFTVTRSINGVVKAQTSGTDVRLWDAPRWAL